MTHTNHPAGHGVWDDAGHFPPRDNGAPLPKQRRKKKLAGLAWAIEVEIVPYLVSVHKAAVESSPQKAADDRSPSAHVEFFVELVLTHDVREICATVDALRATGLSLEHIYLGVLAPAAHQLRDLWIKDRCDFAEATLALWRMQQVLREFSLAFRRDFVHREHGLRVLLAPAPGERQDLGYAMFGLVLVAEFFLREGWDTWIEPNASSDDFAAVVRSQWFDAAEFLVCGDKTPDALAPCVQAVRRDSPNPSLGIMVCGQPFMNNLESVRLFGADWATSAKQPDVLQARSLAGSFAGPC